MPDHEPTYPVLDRAAFLIERANIPRYYPAYCAELGQLWAAMAADVRWDRLPEDDSS